MMRAIGTTAARLAPKMGCRRRLSCIPSTSRPVKLCEGLAKDSGLLRSNPGQVVEVEIEGIGTLVNPVVG
jgi:hypothetical protein